MPVVDAKGLHKSYGARQILAGVDLTIRTGERVGVVGRNGAGKSTLARVLAGIEVPDAGTLAWRRGATVRYLAQSPVFEGDPTAWRAAATGLTAWSSAVERYEAASAALSAGSGNTDELIAEQALAAEELERAGGWEQRHRVESLLGQLGVTRPEARVSTLSGGEQRRIALAAILVERPTLAILDEPTNHLDAETIDWLESHLTREYPGAVLLITHDRYLLDRVAVRTVEVAGGNLYSYDGGYELYLQQKAEREAHAARTERNRQNFLRRELEWLRRQPKARGTKQKARVERAEQALERRRPMQERTADLDISVSRSGKTLLELRELGVCIGERTLISNLTLFLTEGERIGIVGRNGTGKTTLLRTLVGEVEPSRGNIVRGANTEFAYFDQTRSGLDPNASVFDNVASDQTRFELGGSTLEPIAYLERFGFDPHQQRQMVGSLSGGERARVALARLLRRRANVALLDEPTNDLDVATLGALEAMLVDSGVTALVVTHDRWFLDRIATSILAFEEDGRVTHYPGNYSDFLRLRAQAQAEAPVNVEANARSRRRATDEATSSKPKKLTFAENRELDGLPDAIDRADALVNELSERLADPTVYADGAEAVRALTAELAAAKEEAARLLNRWEELEMKKSGSGG